MNASPDPQRLHSWLQTAIEKQAADLHVVAGYPPTARIHGDLIPVDNEVLDGETIRELLLAFCPPDRKDLFLGSNNLDFSSEAKIFTGQSRHRFRTNFFMNSDQIGACIRIIPDTIPDFDWANFPYDLAHRLAHIRNGLVLLSGTTGSGKTTTLAMIVNMLVEEGGYRILTIEQPVEYLFPRSERSIVTQREVGRDVQSFADGLKYGLRQDPDVILVGEIRDRETASMALSAAETGHLVFSTVHTRDAKGVVTRFTDLFPQSSQQEVRAQLALSLRAVVAQHLLPGATAGSKRELALEIMFNNSAIGAAIRTGKIESMDNYILTGRNDGMLMLDESIQQLLIRKRISREVAERFVSDKRYLSV